MRGKGERTTPVGLSAATAAVETINGERERETEEREREIRKRKRTRVAVAPSHGFIAAVAGNVAVELPTAVHGSRRRRKWLLPPCSKRKRDMCCDRERGNDLNWGEEEAEVACAGVLAGTDQKESESRESPSTAAGLAGIRFWSHRRLVVTLAGVLPLGSSRRHRWKLTIGAAALFSSVIVSLIPLISGNWLKIGVAADATELTISEWLESTRGLLESIHNPPEMRSLQHDSSNMTPGNRFSAFQNRFCGRRHRSDVYVSRSDRGGLRADDPTYDNSWLSGVVHDRGADVVGAEILVASPNLVSFHDVVKGFMN
ncbi:hypothetical protein PIB30_074768 [Stylosanthes scabra]|uniref:Uncharacterized protein n=1 Tax=Stylosanthes scabra TaxID=79078 RepID=A0ABU6YR47_9FABA|nr:hypothetical protein [Stylosanthes scabra]